MADIDGYVKQLERDVERDNKTFSEVGEVVDEAIYYTSVSSLRKALIRVGNLVGLRMPTLSEIAAEDENDSDDIDDIYMEDWDDD